MNYIELSPHNCSGIVHLKSTFENVLAVANFSCEFVGEILVVKFDEISIKFKPQHHFQASKSTPRGHWRLEYSLQRIDDFNALWQSFGRLATLPNFQPFEAILSLLGNFGGEYSFAIDRLVILNSRTVSVDCRVVSRSPELHWRIGFLYDPNLTSLDLVVASNCFQGEVRALQALESLEICCKGCKSELVKLESCKLVPLPSTVFLEAREGISCEECHPGNLQRLKLTARDGLVYINDEELIVPLNDSLTASDRCKSCNLRIGAVKFGFIRLLKDYIAVTNSCGDVFWRHFLHKHHLEIVTSSSTAFECVDVNGRILKIIKGSRDREAFVYFNFSLAQALKVLYRIVKGDTSVKAPCCCKEESVLASCKDSNGHKLLAFGKNSGESGAAQNLTNTCINDSNQKVTDTTTTTTSTTSTTSTTVAHSTTPFNTFLTLLQPFSSPKEPSTEWAASLIPY